MENKNNENEEEVKNFDYFDSDLSEYSDTFFGLDLDKDFDHPGDQRIRREAFIENFYYEEPFIDFCKNYRLEDTIKEKIFNRKFNSDEKLASIFLIENNFTELFIEVIKKRIKTQSNIILVIYGEPHSGKSIIAQAIAFEIIGAFTKYTDLESKIKMCFSDSEFHNTLPTLEPGDIILRDESPKTTGTGSRTMSQNLDNIIEIVRANQNCFIFVSPKRVEANVVTYYLEMAGKKAIYVCPECQKEYINIDPREKKCDDCEIFLELNYKKSSCRCILYDPMYDNGKIPIGRLFFNLPDDMVFRESYLTKKTINIQKQLKFAGLDTPSANKDKHKQNLKNLIEQCKKYNIRTKTEIRTQIGIYNRQFDPDKEAEKMIKGIPMYITDLINEAVLHLTEKIEQEKEVPKTAGIFEKFIAELTFNKYRDSYSDEKIFSRYKKFQKYANHYIEIYKLRKAGKTNKEAYELLKLKDPNIKLKNETSVRQAYSRFLSAMSYHRGRLFSHDFANDLRTLGYFDKVVWDDTKGKPDVIAHYENENKLYVFSCKCANISGRRTIIRKDDLKPEINICNQNKLKYNVTMFIVILDYQRDNLIIEKYDFNYPSVFKLN